MIVTAFDGAGHGLISGWFERAATFGRDSYTSSAEDVFVAKIDADDHTVFWSRSFGADGRDAATDVTAVGSGRRRLVSGRRRLRRDPELPGEHLHVRRAPRPLSSSRASPVELVAGLAR